MYSIYDDGILIKNKIKTYEQAKYELEMYIEQMPFGDTIGIEYTIDNDDLNQTVTIMTTSLTCS